MSKKIFIILLVFLVLITVAVIRFSNKPITNSNSEPTEDNQVACTMEAKLCPDGSSVGRSGPKCEFTPCPE